MHPSARIHVDLWPPALCGNAKEAASSLAPIFSPSSNNASRCNLSPLSKLSSKMSNDDVFKNICRLTLLTFLALPAATAVTCYNPPAAPGENGTVQVFTYTTCNSMYSWGHPVFADTVLQTIFRGPDYLRRRKSLCALCFTCLRQ